MNNIENIMILNNKNIGISRIESIRILEEMLTEQIGI